mgnify:CR=1 FL=1
MAELNWKHTSRFVAAACAMDCSAGLFLVAVPCLAETLGASSLQLGVLGAVRGVSYALACLLAALVIDRFTRRTCVLMSCCLLACMVIATSLSTGLWQINAWIVAWSVALSFFWPALLAWVGDSHSAAQLGRATAVINVGWSLGLMCGNGAAGWLYEFNPVAPFLAAAPLALLAASAAVLGVPHHRSRPVPRPSGPRRVGVRRRLAAGWAGNFASMAMIGLMSIVFLNLWVDRFGGSKGMFGTLVGLLGLGRTLMFIVGLRRSDLLRDWRLAALAQIIAGGMIGTVALTDSRWWVAAVFIVVGLNLGVCYYMALYRSLEEKGDRGFKAAMHEATLLGGMLLGSLGGGAAADLWGIRTPYALIAASVVVLVALQALLNISAGRDEACA